jgi:regulator of protease activity HflC (stomatin/prohibitin superfamily)
MLAYIIGWGFVIVMLLWWLKPWVLVPHGTVVMLDWGQTYFKTLQPGLHVIMPFLQSPRKVHWTHDVTIHGRWQKVTYASEEIKTTECFFELPFLDVYTKNNVGIGVQMTVSYTIIDPKHVVYEVQNLFGKMQTELESTLRDIMLNVSFEAFNKNKIEKAMMDRNGRDVWGLYGIRIDSCRMVDYKLARQLEEASTINAEESDRRKAEISTMDLVYECESSKLDKEIKIAEKRNRLALIQAENDLAVENVRHEAERKRRQQRADDETAVLQQRVSLVKTSGFSEHFFIAYWDKQAMLALTASGGSERAVIYVPSTLNAVGDITASAQGHQALQ